MKKLMQKLLGSVFVYTLLSALLSVGGLTLSQSAMANDDYTKHINPNNTAVWCTYYPNDSACNNNAYSGPTMYRHRFVGLFYDRNDQPYFSKSASISASPATNMDFHIEYGLKKCNASSKRAPCTYERAIANTGCLGYVNIPNKQTIAYSDNSCKQVRKVLEAECLARNNDAKVCKAVKTKTP